MRLSEFEILSFWTCHYPRSVFWVFACMLRCTRAVHTRPPPGDLSRSLEFDRLIQEARRRVGLRTNFPISWDRIALLTCMIDSRSVIPTRIRFRAFARGPRAIITYTYWSCGRQRVKWSSQNRLKEAMHLGGSILSKFLFTLKNLSICVCKMQENYSKSLQQCFCCSVGCIKCMRPAQICY